MARRKIPPELLNYEAWSKVDEQMLPEEDKVRFIRLSDAVRAACDGVKSGEIKRRFGVGRSLLSYYLRRCTSTHPDGRLRGFRALVIAHEREDYVRRADLNSGPRGGGLAGAFRSLLRDCPKSTKWLHNRLKPDDGTKFQAAGLNLAAIHQDFLDQLRKESRRSDQYPFTVERNGYEALCAYVRKRIAEGDDQAARARYGDQAVQAKGRNSGKHSLFMPYVAFERTAYDEWQLPDIGTVTIVADDGKIDVPLRRLWFCPIVCFRSNAVAGYAVSMPGRFGSFELLAAFECAIHPRPRIVHSAFKDLEPLLDEGLPTAVLPQARGRRICSLVVDNHLAHLANRVVHDLRQRTGVSISFGKVRSWIERYVVEGLFSELAVRLKKLPSTTGSGPTDPAVRDPVEKAVRYKIRLGDLLALIDQLVCRHNAKRRRILMSATPNEVVARDWAEGCRLDIVPRYPEALIADPCVAIEVEYPTVRGSRENNRVPYVELDGVEHTNAILKQSWSLIGQQLMVQIRGDYRTVRAYRLDGTEFGPLSVGGRWALSPHTREMRKEINRLTRQGILDARATDPVDHYNRYLAKEALKKSKGKRRPPITREAGRLAQSLSVPGGAGDPPNFTYNMQMPVLPAKAMAKPRNRRAFFSAGKTK